MKHLLLLVLFVFGGLITYGQWNSMGLSTLSSEDEGDYDGHNLGGGTFDDPTTILLTINGQNVKDESIYANLGYYIIGYYKTKSSQPWYYETVGDIIITDEPIDDEGNTINGTKVSFSEVEDYSTIHTTPEQWSVWETIGIIFDWSDFASGNYVSKQTNLGFWEVIIVNKNSGYCVSSGRIKCQQEIKIDLQDPTLFTPSGPTLAVAPITVGCWSSGETFDLADAVTVSGDDEGSAVVKYYTDNDGGMGTEISSEVTMGADFPNPSGVKEKRYYWAKIDGDDNDKAQKIEVTVYQKPEVTLSVKEGTEVCANTSLTLETSGNNFGSSAYHYYANTLDNNGELHRDGTGNSFTLTAGLGATTTCFVEVSTTNGCKGTASVAVTVKQVIAGDDVNIAVKDNKTPICKGDKVELSVAVDENKYPGKITYQWSTGVGTGETNIAEATEANITVYPETQTTYNVHVTLDGCTSSTSGASQVIAVNSLPTPTISVDNAPKCAETEVTLTANGADGCSYAWSNDASGTNASVKVTLKSGPNTFGLTATDANGCKGTAPEVTITGAAKPNPTILVDNAAPKASLCSGTKITLTASGATGCSYTWSNVSTADEKKAQAEVTINEKDNEFGLTVKDTIGCEGTAEVVKITGLKLPTVTIANVNDVCANAEVSLEATPTWVTSTGATGEWTKGGEKLTTTLSGGKLVATAQVPSGKNTYTINVTDGNGCPATRSVDVMGNVLKLTPLTVTSMSVKVGETVTLQTSASWNGSSLAEGLYTRAWKRMAGDAETVLSGTGTTITDSPNIDGTRYKVVAEKEGCRDSLTSNALTVTTDPFEFPGNDPNKAIASVGNRFDVCYGEDLSANPVKLYVTVQGGSKEYAYSWTYPSSVTATANNDTLTITAIDYENFGNNQPIAVAVNDGTKTINASQTFGVRPIPQININGANGGAVLQACKGVNLTLTAAIQGGGGDSFKWATGQKGSILGAVTSAVGTTTYRVTATYGGCSNTDSVKVQVNELPSVSLVAQVDGASVEAVCPGTEITLVAAVDGVDSPTFSWKQGASSLTGARPTIAVNARTTYGVEYTDATTTCKAEASATVNVHSKVTLAVGVTPASQVCPGTEVTMTITNGDADTYVWTSSNTSEDMSAVKGATYAVTPVSRTTYTVSGKDGNGCEANPISATLDVRDAPTLQLAKNELHGCEGGSVDMRNAVNNLGNATLKVRNAAGDVLNGTTVTAAGTYSIYIDGGSCSSNEETVEVQFHALPTVTLVASLTAVCPGETITLTASGEGTTDLTYTPNQSWTEAPTSAGSASYTVSVKDDNGCTATASTSVTVKPLPDVAIVDPGTICAGAEVTLRATGADTYAWTGGVTDGTGDTYKVTPTATSNTFTVTGTKDGCTAEAVSRTLTIQEAPVLAVARSLTPCVGESIDLKSVFDPSAYTLTFFDKDKGTMATTAIASVQLSDTLFYAKATTSAAQGNCSSEFVTIRVAPKALPQLNISGARAICRGEETLLTVEGNDATYTWSPAGKDGANSGATMTVNPTTDTEYTVTARGNNNCTAEAKWHLIVNSLPKLAWDSGNETALIAGQSKTWYVQLNTSSTSPYTYIWKHNGEVDANYTHTEYELTGVENPEVLAVKVIDANKCSDSLEISIPVSTLDDLAIDIETDVEEGKELCIGNVAHLKVITTKGALTSDATYEWSPVEGLDATDVANPVFTATAAGTKTYTVKVTEQGRDFTATVNLGVKNAEAPVIDWDPTNPESFVMGEAFVMKTVVTKGSSSGNHYTWLKPENGLDLPQYSIATADKNAYDFAVVMTDANGCRTTDTLTTSIAIGGADVIEIKTEPEVKRCAVGNVTLSVEKTAGTDMVDYRWERVGNTLVMNDEDSPNVTIGLDGVPAGFYTFRITVTDQTDPTNKAMQEVLLEIVSAPTVKLEETCVALHKDSTIVLKVANPGDYTYLWQESLFGTAWGTPTDKGYGQTRTVRMDDQDMRYILTARDDESGCEASDTATIYRVPDAPTVEIDTNTNRLDIKLAWGSVNGNDGYTIWSRKWDPYCLTSADGGVYKEAGNTMRFEWAPAKMDTLEFFYVTADRNVCSQTYYSVTSDTVGYYLMDLHENPVASSLVWYPLYFDMSRYGVRTTEDLIARNLDVLISVTAWDYPMQDWGAATTFWNPREDDPESTDPVIYDGVFDLDYNTVIRLEASRDGKIIQYGHLPEPITFKIEGAETGGSKFSLAFIQPFRMDLKTSTDIVDDLLGKIFSISDWNFDLQGENGATTYYDPREDDPESTEPIMYDGEFLLKVLLPIRIESAMDNDCIYWKK